MAEVDVMDRVEAILNTEVDVMDSRESQGDEKSSDTQKPDNYEYRLRAAQRQQQKATERMASMESKLDQALSKLAGGGDAEPSSDDIIDDVKSLKAQLAQLRSEQERQRDRSQDRAFYSNHPELNPAEISMELTDFLSNRKTLATALVKGEIDIEDVYVQYANRKGINSKPAVQNSDSVFGGLKSDASPRRSNQSVSKLQSAYDTLDDKNSKNKASAVKTIENEIMKEIQSQLY